LLEEKGQLEEAASKIREAHAIFKRTLGASHPIVAYPSIGLARILMKKEMPEEAEPWIREALSIRNNTFENVHPEIIQVKNMLGLCLTQIGQHSEAEAVLMDSFESQESGGKRENELWMHTLEHLIGLYEDWDQPEKVAFFQEKLSESYSGMNED